MAIYRIVRREYLVDEYFYEADSEEQALALYDQDVVEGNIDSGKMELIDVTTDIYLEQST